MATKAQDARGEEIRAARAKKAKKAESEKKAKPEKVVDKDTPRNDSKRAAKKGGAAAEGSLPGKTSRKSTRRATGRVKPDSQLKRRQTRATTSPDARARRAAAKKK